MNDRNLPEVIDQMLAEIPQNEDKLCVKLRSIRNAALYAAPESMTNHWNHVSGELRVEFGETYPVAGWQRVVADIFRGNPVGRKPDDTPLPAHPSRQRG